MPNRSHLNGFLILTAIAALALELLFLSLQFDAGLLLNNPAMTFWQLLFGYFGSLAKIIVVAVFILLYICKSRLPHIWKELLAQFSPSRFYALICLEFISYLGLYYFSKRIFSEPESASHLPATVYLAWLGCVVLTVMTLVSSIAHPRFIYGLIKEERKAIALTTVATLIVWTLAMLSQEMWRFLSVINLVEGTFAVSHFLLGAFDPALIYVDSEDKLLGLGEFIIKIEPACSGYEGIGLILAFTLLYLYLNRNELHFPRAFLLLPIGAVVIWLLNSVRIAALVIIGYKWSPEIAVGGFHSQAGWITFILTSLGILWLADHSGLLRQSAAREDNSIQQADEHNLAIATLLPLVALLAVTLLSTAFISGFDYLYPARVLVAAIVIWKVWPALHLTPYRPGWEAMVAGILVFILWILLLGSNPEANADFIAGLAELSQGWGLIWLAFRFLGSAVTVPIAEELAFRAYLLCNLARVEVTTRGKIPVQGQVLMTTIAVVVSSIAFGALHGTWLAGTIAGLIYALVRLRTNHIGDAILAHSVTNGLLCVYASLSGEWWVL